ncbi:TrbC/VirB2 family protein [Halomontanus rarus]|uniref:TrbC/VirB2 family protein n=1 Tax=Halomontanus rarus TaxID=3034020 RepID=UPI001F6016C1
MRRIRTVCLTALLGMTLLTSSAAAQTDQLDCEIPPSLQPLFDLLNTFTELALLAGVGLGTLGLSIAGIMIVVPGQDWTRRGKDVAKHVIVGTIILLSAQAIVGFIVARLGSTVCV